MYGFWKRPTVVTSESLTNSMSAVIAKDLPSLLVVVLSCNGDAGVVQYVHTSYQSKMLEILKDQTS
jgi:hypothetical protein